MADWLGAAIAVVSPERALQRARALYHLQIVNDALAKRSYDGAQAGTRWGGWRGSRSSANAEIAKAHDRLKARGRDLIRNDPHARRAKNILVGQFVGTGIVASSSTGIDQLDDKVDGLYDEWSDQADAAGMESLDGLVALSVAAMVEGGDSILRRRMRRVSDGLPVPMQIQALEGDYLDTQLDGARNANGYTYKGGVGFDDLDRRQVYRLFRSHPGDPWPQAGARMDSVDVDARDIIHLYLQERLGQVRGVSWFAPVISLLRDKGDFQEASLVKKKTESLFGVAIKSAETGDGSPPLSGATNASTKSAEEPLAEELSPGGILRLKLGEDLTAFAPSSVAGDLDAFMMHTLMAAGAGLNVTYDQLTGDLRGANFSSMKVGKSDQRRFVEQIQWLLLIPRVYRVVWNWFIEAAIYAGKLERREGGYPAEFTPPSHEPIQPKEDQEADYFSMLSGRMTLKQYIEKWGYPFRRQIRDQKKALAAYKAAGLELPQMPGAAPSNTAKPAAQT